MHRKGPLTKEKIQGLTLGKVRQIAGHLDARRLTFGIVASRFNESLTRWLVTAAVTCLKEHGAKEKDITLVWVPGSYEIPAVVQRLARKRRFSALIALGTVIQGQTQHAEMINLAVSRSLGQIARDFDVPVIYEVVPAYNLKQAAARCTSGRDSRGWYAARAAIEMARVWEKLA